MDAKEILDEVEEFLGSLDKRHFVRATGSSKKPFEISKLID